MEASCDMNYRFRVSFRPEYIHLGLHDMATLPKHIYTQITPDAGTGLFASEAIPPGVEILRIERPLVSVLDSPHLKDTCSECSLWLPQNDDDRDPKCKRLKACQACKVTKYCCKVGLFRLALKYPAKRSINYCSKQSCIFVSQVSCLSLLPHM